MLLTTIFLIKLFAHINICKLFLRWQAKFYVLFFFSFNFIVFKILFNFRVWWRHHSNYVKKTININFIIIKTTKKKKDILFVDVSTTKLLNRFRETKLLHVFVGVFIPFEYFLYICHRRELLFVLVIIFFFQIQFLTCCKSTIFKALVVNLKFFGVASSKLQVVRS